MTQKEKAAELVDGFYNTIPLDGFKGTYLTFRSHAKKCATFFCDEIIEYVSSAKNDKFLHIRIEFWQSVKEEIKKL